LSTLTAAFHWAKQWQEAKSALVVRRAEKALALFGLQLQ
jgi:hypothetical protein